MALRSKDVKEALGLLEDQQEKVDAVFAASYEEMQKLFRGGPGADATARQERAQKFQEQMQKLNEDRDTKLMAMLTEEQKAKFDELKGSPSTSRSCAAADPVGPADVAAQVGGQAARANVRRCNFVFRRNAEYAQNGITADVPRAASAAWGTSLF